MTKTLRLLLLIACISLAQALRAQKTVTLGYCPNELSDTAYAMVMSDKGVYTIQAAIKIPGARLQYLKGATLNKIRIATEEGMTSSYVWIRPSIDEPGTLSLQRLGITEEGWNEVELQKPYTITGDDIYIGFNGALPIGKGIYFDGEANPNAAYVGNGVTWNNYYEEGKGSLCIQAIVETSEDTPTSDIAIEACTFDEDFTKVGQSVGTTFTISNYGTEEMPMPRLFYSIGDGEETEVPTEGTLKANESRNIATVISTQGTQEGHNTLHIRIDANDGYQVNNTFDKELCCYETAFERKVLLEHFTTLPCINCPLGHTVLSTLLADRNDYVWVSHHVGYQEDELTVQDSYDISSPLGISSAPLACFDRTILPISQSAVSPAFGIASSEIDETVALLEYYFNQRSATPAFVSVGIENSYDADSRQLTTTISGERTSLLSIFYPETCLTVLLTEDSVETEEAQKGSGETVHNHVYRCSLTSIKGDDMDWSSDSYSYTFSHTLPKTWNADNLHVVAFVSRPISGEANQLEILNANQILLSQASGINATTSSIDEEILSREYYNLSGQKLTAPTSGLYLERVTTSHGSRTIKHIQQ